MKQAISFVLGVGLVFGGASAHAEDTYRITTSTAVQKFEVKKEVERREHTPVTDVDIVSTGEAQARFKGGVAEVNFAFRDPMLSCQVVKDRECGQRMRDNPLGFAVLSYKSRRN